jgi:hypothetical protein
MMSSSHAGPLSGRLLAPFKCGGRQSHALLKGKKSGMHSERRRHTHSSCFFLKVLEDGHQGGPRVSEDFRASRLCVLAGELTRQLT